MKHTLFSVSAVFTVMGTTLLVIFGSVSTAYAASSSSVSSGWAKYCTAVHWACGSTAPGSDLVMRVANQVVFIIEAIIGVVAVLAVIWGSAMIATSGFNEENRNKGKNMITVAVVGSILAVLSAEVIKFVIIIVNSAI